MDFCIRMDSLFCINAFNLTQFLILVILLLQTVSRNNWHIYLVKDRNGFKCIANIKQFKVAVDGTALHIHISICSDSQLMVVAKDFCNTL